MARRAGLNLLVLQLATEDDASGSFDEWWSGRIFCNLSRSYSIFRVTLDKN